MSKKVKAGTAMVSASETGAVGLGDTVDDPTFTAAAESLAEFRFLRDLTLQEGQGVKGTFVGFGEKAEFADDKTGEVREVPTAIIQIANVRYRLLCPTMLERLLGAVKAGEVVAIIRGGYRNTRKGHRITDYAVGVETGSGG